MLEKLVIPELSGVALEQQEQRSRAGNQPGIRDTMNYPKKNRFQSAPVAYIQRENLV